ncbi:DUF1707 domain-containing protein [Nocardioides sp.]|uniref:DUF1707 SHOCT-like domain-containing protein n=1 Tax=Nocardioides sp. TaxID=35761 RepID=UPI0035120592
MSETWWRDFSHDPRVRSHAVLRATDRDRDHVLTELARAYADGRLDRAEFDRRQDAAQSARTLGDLRGLCADLRPGRNSLSALVPLAPLTRLIPRAAPPTQAEIAERAHRAWRDQRRGAVALTLTTSLVSWAVWLGAGADVLVWPVLVMLAGGGYVAQVQWRRASIEAEERRRLELKAQRRRRPRPLGG